MPSTSGWPTASPTRSGTTAPAPTCPTTPACSRSRAGAGAGFAPDPRLVARVRRQFAPLHPRRVLLSRQVDGSDLDLDAAVASEADLRAGRTGSDRVWQASRAVARDLAVAILMDCSRSTEAAVGEASVIDTAREALAALAAGIDSAGDRLGLWGFSSLRRDRVFLTRAKGFDEPMSPAVTARIGGFRPGHYTRLGAAIRHASAMLAAEAAARRLLLVLTDGKPNDLDHYEGVHGIEDSRMAVREARAAGPRRARGGGRCRRAGLVRPHLRPRRLHAPAAPGALATRAARDLSDADHGDLRCATCCRSLPSSPRRCSPRPSSGRCRRARRPGAPRFPSRSPPWRSSSPSERRNGWSAGAEPARLAADGPGLYPFAAGAAAVNLFFLSLVLSWLGLPVLTPGLAVLGGALLGLPATWAFARHLRRLMAEADATR